MPIIQSIIQGVYRGGAQVQQAINHLNQYQAAANQATQAQQRLAAQSHRTRLTIMELMRMMVVFGIGLQVINALTMPGKFLANGIKQLIDLQHGLNLVNTVLGITRKELKALGDEALLVGSRIGITGDSVTKNLYNIGQSITGIDIGNLTKAQAAMILFQKSSKFAQVADIKPEEAIEGVLRMMNSMQFGIEQVDHVIATLFQTINLGIINGQELVQNIGDITSALGFLTSAMEKQKKMRVTDEMMAYWAAVSQVLPASEAATTAKTFMNALIKPSSEGAALMGEFKQMFGVDTTLEAFISRGPAKYFEDLFGIVRKNGPLMAYVGGQTEDLTNLQGNEAKMTAIQTQLFGTLFGNIRGLAGVLAVGSKEMQLFNKVLKEMGMATSEYDRAIKELENDTRISVDKMKASWSVFSMQVAGSSLKGFNRSVNELYMAIQAVINRRDMVDAGFFERISAMYGEIIRRLNYWWTHGGKQDWKRFWQDRGREVGTFIFSLFDENDNNGIFSKMGSNAATAFIDGFKESFKKADWGAILTSPFTRFIANYKMFGFPAALAIEGATNIAPAALEGITGGRSIPVTPFDVIDQMSGKNPNAGISTKSNDTAGFFGALATGGSLASLGFFAINKLMGGTPMIALKNAVTAAKTGAFNVAKAAPGGIFRGLFGEPTYSNIQRGPGGAINPGPGRSPGLLGDLKNFLFGSPSPGGWNQSRGPGGVFGPRVPTPGTLGILQPFISSPIVQGAMTALNNLKNTALTTLSSGGIKSLWQQIQPLAPGIIPAIGAVLLSPVAALVAAGITTGAGIYGIGSMLAGEPLGSTQRTDPFNFLRFKDTKATREGNEHFFNPSGKPMSTAPNVTVNMNFEKLAGELNMQKPSDLEKIKMAISESLADGLREAGLTVSTIPVLSS